MTFRRCFPGSPGHLPAPRLHRGVAALSLVLALASARCAIPEDDELDSLEGEVISPANPAVYGSLCQPAARHLHVSAAKGKDTYPGTVDLPFRTIAKAISAVTAGTTVHVAPGTYPGPLVSTASGTPSARICFKSTVQWGAKIRASAQFIWRNTGSHVDVVGFDIADPLTEAGQIGGKSDNALVTGSNGRVMLNRVHHVPVSAAAMAAGNGGSAINLASYAVTNVQIIGNVVHHIGNPPDDPDRNSQAVQGIYYPTFDALITNNIVYAVEDSGIHMWHKTGRATISNNLVFDCGRGINIGSSEGTFANAEVNNNISIHHRVAGITCGGTCKFSGSFFRNNLAYGSPTNIYKPPTGVTVIGTLAATDAQFVDFQLDGGGDYHLRPTSPARDRGSDVGAPATDFDGSPRPSGAAVDVGPYELVAGAPPSPAPPR
jgi:hypothetical protein